MSLRFSIEEANYDESCRRIITTFYFENTRYLMFYKNTFYWADHYGKVWQINQTFGDTTRLQTTVNQIVDSGIVLEGKNDNLQTIFLTSGQTTLN